jgi:hypothetical protein
MSLQSFRIGVAGVQLPVDSATAPATMVAVTLAASAISPTDLLNNDVNNILDTAATYQFMVGIVGRDTTNGGLTVGPCSKATGIVSGLTTGQAIELYIPNASLPANFQYGMCMAIFMKKNAGSWQLADFGYIDHNGAQDFNHLVVAEPLSSAAAFSAATSKFNYGYYIR